MYCHYISYTARKGNGQGEVWVVVEWNAFWEAAWWCLVVLATVASPRSPLEGILGFSHWEVTGAMTLHPCPDDFFQDFVLMPFQSSSLSSLSDSSLSSLGGHRCIDVALALHCQCLLRCPDVLTEIYFQNFNQSKWHNIPLFFAICLQI